MQDRVGHISKSLMKRLEMCSGKVLKLISFGTFPWMCMLTRLLLCADKPVSNASGKPSLVQYLRRLFCREPLKTFLYVKIVTLLGYFHQMKRSNSAECAAGYIRPVR